MPDEKKVTLESPEPEQKEYGAQSIKVHRRTRSGTENGLPCILAQQAPKDYIIWSMK